MSKPVDLDAVRAELEPRCVKLAGREWDLPPEIPLLALEHFYQGRVSAFIECMFGEDSLEELLPVVSATTIKVLFRDVYGFDPEGQASSASSKSTGKRSRQTSKRTTG